MAGVGGMMALWGGLHVLGLVTLTGSVGRLVAATLVAAALEASTS